ncbi:DDE-type integrase/transposase/recombinase [Anaerobium acetethylicum]|uniref:Mu transposase, C-terminal n=1 Tax=Anaerobium acetethylicum TaxID=1619234 RepID=A0A1D3TZG5_9FIRM|nr:DDE-type integrase/transposase/recombinase [Anaerobium acetethylicum]SCP99964.1 Mu transposase, C-terminal [Anaerobium acetethylicum]
MNNTFNDKSFSEAAAIARVRFAVVAPVIQELFAEPTKTAYYKRVAEKPLKMPDGSEVMYNYNTFEKWEKLYLRHGIDGLIPKRRSDIGVPRALSDAAIAEIYRLKETFPRINATLIYQKLIEDGFITPSGTSVSAVQRFIKRNDLKSARNPNIKDRKAFEAEFPCDMYQADTCYSVFITENGVSRRTYLFHIVDDHSRMIVGARFFYQDNAYNFQQVLKDAIARSGICSKIYLDNGGSYSNEQLSLILGSLGIIEIHTPVRDGAAKAKVERSFRTIKDTWLHGLDISGVDSLDALNRLLADYVHKRNNSFNRDISGTPMERYSRHLDRIRFPKSREWLDECFMNRMIRKVNNDSTVSINSISYDCPQQFIRMKVEVRFLPDDMKNAYILYEGKRYPIRKTNKVENFRTKRNNTPSIDYSRTGGVDSV